MITECLACDEKCGKPQAVASSIVFLVAAAVTGLIVGFGLPLSFALCHSRILRLVWSAGLLAIAIPLWFGLSWTIWQLPRWLTVLDRRFRRCPRCGSRKWGEPHYSGFGM